MGPVGQISPIQELVVIAIALRPGGVHQCDDQRRGASFTLSHGAWVGRRHSYRASQKRNNLGGKTSSCYFLVLGPSQSLGAQMTSLQSRVHITQKQPTKRRLPRPAAMKGNRVVAMRELRIRSERHAAQVATMVSTHERGAGGCVCGGCVTQSRLACEKGELRAGVVIFL